MEAMGLTFERELTERNLSNSIGLNPESHTNDEHDVEFTLQSFEIQRCVNT